GHDGAVFFFASRRRDTSLHGDWSSDVCSSDLNLARQNLRKVKAGDRVLYYHTGKERAIVGEMKILTPPQADPTSADPNAVVVKVKAVRRWRTPLSLERIKKERALQDWDLVRLSRLSIVPVS